MSIPYRPLGSRLLVKRAPEKTITSGGILLPGVVQESLHSHPIKVEVLAVGPNVVEVKAGDVVLIDKNGGTVVSNDDGDDIRVVLEEETYGVFV